MKKLLELINEFSKVEEYRINTQKSIVALHIDNRRSEGKIKRKFHL